MNILISLRSERLKTKRSASFYLALAAAAFTPSIGLLDLFFDGVKPDKGGVIFNEMFSSWFGITATIPFPIFIILICTLLPQIEFKNNTWKQLLSSPQTKWNVFFAKFINLQLFVFLFIVFNQLLVFLSAVILHFKEPSLQVLNQPINGFQIATTLTNSYVALLALATIQFWLGLRFRNFMVSIAIGMGLWFMGTILATQLKPGLIQYFPYSFHMSVGFPQFQAEEISTIRLCSLGYTAAFLLIGFLSFRKRSLMG